MWVGRGTNTKIKSVSSQFLPAKRIRPLAFCQWEGYLLVSGIPICQVSYNLLWVSQVVLVVNNLPANAGDVRDVGSIPGWGRSPGEGNGNPLQYSCLDNPMDRGAWWATVHRVTKSQTQLKRLSTHAHTSLSQGSLRPSVHFWRKMLV